MSKEKLTSIILGIVLAVIIITLAIIGIIVLSKKSQTPEAQEENEGQVVRSEAKGDSDGIISLDEINVPENSSSKRKMMEGYEVIGVLEIPKTKLKTNILAETTKKSLEIAVAQIYTTSSLNQPGNTVIYGHNYRNSLFFSKNDELVIGDKVFITDEANHEKKEYKIKEIFETTATDTSFYTRTAQDTLGKAQVTLSTCTDDADQTDRRLIIIAETDN